MIAADSVDSLYAHVGPVVAALVGGTSHVEAVKVAPPAEYYPNVRAWFSPRTRIATISPEIDRQLDAFYDTTLNRRRGLNANEANEIWQLGLVKTAMVTLVATVLRGVGPADDRLMRAEWDAFWQRPHVHTVTAGVCELTAALIVDQVTAELGMVARDPRLTAARPLQAHYAAQSTLIDSLIGELSGTRHTAPGAELAALAASGSSELATWRLGGRFAGAPGVESADRPAALSDYHATIAAGLAGFGADWAVVDSGEPEADTALAERWTRVLSRDLNTSALRARSGPGGMPDITRLAAEISKAAQAAQEEVTQKMDHLQDVWTMMEEMGVEG